MRLAFEQSARRRRSHSDRHSGVGDRNVRHISRQLGVGKVFGGVPCHHDQHFPARNLPPPVVFYGSADPLL